MSRLLWVSLLASVASLAVGTGAALGATPPKLPNLAAYFKGQHPKVRYVTGSGLRFACYDFYGRDGVLSECFAVARVSQPKAKPKASGPSA